ncbi:dihydroxyacetone kinase phosphoryl donor subunit DhaM [Streptomonospora nanhaiensis]|uniref:phosphoenolpyruvate--glycerone phosphotransferase n=1 Tax=Streptomonospora nanhaiensis TaxID=1323731 RepID=A0A853BK40_9ACTN|nr:dihydroxyacetone kinase phosphoryl donor subunit DhaM [Streptomonospora nanhaiensis]MBV2363275.1 phosphoenolpyruvate--protein phosphotransferase [Streptomonospora nanhaiensis]MBX9389901.1 phosphoenolpyruvate--protein phosphotransferase [Streptomonospora nanhaiensis]NYI95633.1 PTS hybrid protein [Streptomonospora nanhaiensis]
METKDTAVGVVLVSHSARLAQGLSELIDQLGSAGGRVFCAGGTDDGGIGTSYERIAAAVAEADSGAGVVVLPDIGSAVLTARMVLEDDPRDDVVLVDAPFVEGAVAAAVTAGTGADLAAVVSAAREARQAAKIPD